MNQAELEKIATQAASDTQLSSKFWVKLSMLKQGSLCIEIIYKKTSRLEYIVSLVNIRDDATEIASIVYMVLRAFSCGMAFKE